MNIYRREGNTKLLSTMTRWSSVENNVIFVFRKTLESGISEPYRSIFENFVTRVNRGMDAVEAIEMEIKRVKSPFMKNILVNINSVIINNGDLHKLLSKFEYEAFKIEEALWDNNIKTYKDRILMLVLVAMVIGTLIRMFAIEMTNNWITIAAVVSVLIALIVTWSIGRFKY